jgi:hypothetical protein
MTRGGIVLGSTTTMGDRREAALLGLPLEHDFEGRCGCMIGREFFDRIVDDDRFEWLGVLEAQEADPRLENSVSLPDRIAVRSNGVIFEIAIRSLLEQPWEELESMLTFKRDARLLIHETRIVGYYSQTRNWNRSKLAELADRRRAVKYYAVTGDEIRDTRLPKEVADIVSVGRSDDMICDLDKRVAS